MTRSLSRTSVVVVIALLAAHVSVAHAQSFVVRGSASLWHSPNMERTSGEDVKANPIRLGDLAYDNHFMNAGQAPNWGFLVPLGPPAPERAVLDGGNVDFGETLLRGVLHPETLPDVATPAQPYLLDVPKADAVMVVEPYYMFRNKLTAYRVSTFGGNGAPGSVFDTLPTHALSGAPTILVAPERAGCCENMVWSIRFYDLARGTVLDLDCPPGQCGDLVFARPEPDGPLIVAMEVFQTVPGIGSVIETRLAVVEPDGTLAASGRLAYASRDRAVGVSPTWAACASRVLAAKGSPYAVTELTAAKKLDDGRWAFRFDSGAVARTWVIDGVSSRESPPVVFAPPKRHQDKG